MQIAERLVAVNTPVVSEALVHVSDRRHAVRLVVCVQGTLVELRADWCHLGSKTWSDVPRMALRTLVAELAPDLGREEGGLWETAQVVARYVNGLADRNELYELTGCSA